MSFGHIKKSLKLFQCSKAPYSGLFAEYCKYQFFAEVIHRHIPFICTGHQKQQVGYYNPNSSYTSSFTWYGNGIIWQGRYTYSLIYVSYLKQSLNCLIF